MKLRYICVALLAGVALLAAVGAAGAQRTGTYTVVVSGLDNPRDLAFSPQGQLYVAEAGHGGNPADCVAGGPEGDTCPGFTSGISIVNVANGTSQRVVSGLASISGAGGFGAIGVDGISFDERGTLFGVIGESSDAVPDHTFSGDITAGLRAQLGRLIQVNPNGGWKVVADVGHHDFLWSADNKNLVPDQFPDANPYGVFATGGTEWVVDAAANTIDRVAPNGAIHVVAFIPNPAVSDAVPTCIDRGPDGAFYVGQLTGVGNPAGSASIWRFDPTSRALTKWATGLTAITGCGFGANGDFYAVEFSTVNGFEKAGPGEGVVVRVPPGSTSPTTVVHGLSFPGGFAAGSDGSLYVSNWSVAPANSNGGPTGQVVRITP